MGGSFKREIAQMVNEKAARLFDGWDEALIWSCLQGYMGRLFTDNDTDPQSAIIDSADFCFCAGVPDGNLLGLVDNYSFKLIAPIDEAWAKLIRNHFGGRAGEFLRYATKKEPGCFDKEKLLSYVEGLDSRYELRLFDREIFELTKKEPWSRDLSSRFADYDDYRRRGIGTGILHKGELVAGASPYGIFRNGIEIEIDTKPDYRGKGLATVCGAKLILECLERNIYPSWDAHDLRSLHLAEKLGYHLSHSYLTFQIENAAPNQLLNDCRFSDTPRTV